MSNLEKLKQKMMVKPIIKEKEEITVVIKGNKKPYSSKSKKKKEKEDITDDLIDKEMVDQDNIIDEEEIIIEAKEMDEKKSQHPIIIDKTNLDFDRQSIIEKLKSNKESAVRTRPVVKEYYEKIIEPIPLPPEPIRKEKKKRKIKEN
jgi:hypothetical protein